jgi:hypothetical protein
MRMVMQGTDFTRPDDVHRVAERTADAQDLAQVVELVFRVGETQAAATMPGDGLSGLGFKLLVKFDPVSRHPGETGIAERMRNRAGRVPGRAGREFGFFDQQRVGPAFAREVIEQGAADDAAADDHDLLMRGDFHPS